MAYAEVWEPDEKLVPAAVTELSIRPPSLSVAAQSSGSTNSVMTERLLVEPTALGEWLAIAQKESLRRTLGDATTSSVITGGAIQMQLVLDDVATLASTITRATLRFRIANALTHATGLLLRNVHADSILKRLRFLVEAAEEEQIASLTLPDSIKNFAKFFAGQREWTRPLLVLTPSGNLRAEWRRSTREFLGLEFLPGERIHYVLFAPDAQHAAGVARISAITASSQLSALIARYNVTWTIHARRAHP